MLILISVAPSPFPSVVPCVLTSGRSLVYVDFILIMASESGTATALFHFVRRDLINSAHSRSHNDAVEDIFSL